MLGISPIITPPPLGTFDVVIRTQKEFEELIASPTWFDAVSICFVGDGGTLQFRKTDGTGILIPQTVKQIQGMNNAIIEVLNATYRNCLGYASIPAGDEFSINAITLVCSPESYGFNNCTQLTNCTSTAKNSFQYCNRLTNCSAIGGSSGFYDCDQLRDCIAIASSDSVIPSAFMMCNDMTNCTGTIIGSLGHGFRDCHIIVNCTGTSGTSSDTDNSGFRNCTKLTDCTCNGTIGYDRCHQLVNSTGTAQEIVFYRCDRLINCTVNNNIDGVSFRICNQLSNCSGNQFNQCGFLANCIGISTGKKEIAFLLCDDLTDCRGTITEEMRSTNLKLATSNFEGAYERAGEPGASSDNNISGFGYCKRLTNCYGISSNTINAYNCFGFTECTQLTNCTGCGISANGNGYSFYNCEYLNGCNSHVISSTTAFLGGTNTKVDTLTVVAE